MAPEVLQHKLRTKDVVAIELRTQLHEFLGRYGGHGEDGCGIVKHLGRVRVLQLVEVVLPRRGARIRRVEMHLNGVGIQLLRQADGVLNVLPRLGRIADDIVGVRPNPQLSRPAEGLPASLQPRCWFESLLDRINNALSPSFHAYPKHDTTGLLHQGQQVVIDLISPDPRHPGHRGATRHQFLAQRTDEASMRGKAIILKRTDIDTLTPQVRHFIRHMGGRAGAEFGAGTHPHDFTTEVAGIGTATRGNQKPPHHALTQLHWEDRLIGLEFYWRVGQKWQAIRVLHGKPLIGGIALMIMGSPALLGGVTPAQPRQEFEKLLLRLAQQNGVVQRLITVFEVTVQIMPLPDANDQRRMRVLFQGGYEGVRHVDIETRGGDDEHIGSDAGRIVEQLCHAPWRDPPIEQMYREHGVLLQSCLQIFERIGWIAELRVVDFIGARGYSQQQNGVKLHKTPPRVVSVATMASLTRRGATPPTRSAARWAV